ncbi:MAG: glycosyltransferase family 4 protein [Calditrichia bacterium]
MKDQSNPSLQLISVPWWNATAYYAVTVAKLLYQAGKKVYVGGTPLSPPLRVAEEYRLPTFARIHLQSKKPNELLRSFHRLKEFVLKEQIRIIDAHRPEDHLFAGLLRKKFPELVVVRTVGDVRPPKTNPINKWLHLSSTDFFIFSSRANQKRYQNIWPIPEDRCAVIYAGVDTAYFHSNQKIPSLREKLGIPADHIVFGLIGRFSPVKDHQTFLRAAAALLQQTDSASFVISGEEVEISREQLLQFAKDLGIAKNVHFLDKQDDVRRAISAIDVGVVSSRGSEAICRIATEYLSMGKPVIVSDVNVLPEMITAGFDGWIFPPGSAQDLAQCMARFSENPALLKEMKKNARQTAEKRFSEDHFLQETLAAYQQALELKKEKR